MNKAKIILGDRQYQHIKEGIAGLLQDSIREGHTTLKSIAATARLTPVTVAKVRDNQTNPQLYTFVAIARALGKLTVMRLSEIEKYRKAFKPVPKKRRRKVRRALRVINGGLRNAA